MGSIELVIVLLFLGFPGYAYEYLWLFKDLFKRSPLRNLKN